MTYPGEAPTRLVPLLVNQTLQVLTRFPLQSVRFMDQPRVGDMEPDLSPSCMPQSAEVQHEDCICST